jgi:hypothetical protein
MPKGSRNSPFYQFPLCLLQLTHRPDFGRRELAQHIVSWTLVDGGEKWYNNLSRERKDDVDQAVERKHSNHKYPRDFNPNNTRHLSIVRMNERLKLNLGHVGSNIRRYERVKTHRDSYLDTLRTINQDPNGDRQVRVRHDLLWRQLSDQKMPMRRFRVLAGIYAAIGASKKYRVSYDWMRYLAAGYKSEAAYEAVATDRQGRDVAPDLNVLDLPDAPDRMTSIHSSHNARDEGYFRYDAARAYWEKYTEADPPFIGSDGSGMFEPILTAQGAVFRLRKPFFPSGDETPKTGRFPAEDHFSEGDRVVFDARPIDSHPGSGIDTGTVQYCHHNEVIVAADSDGEAHRVYRSSSRPAPISLVEEWIEKARERGGSRIEGDPLLTVDQLRYTRDQLLDTRWLFKYSNGRHAYYSNSMNNEELAQAVEGDKTARLNRQVEEKKAKLKAKQQHAEKRNQLREIERQLDALDESD